MAFMKNGLFLFPTKGITEERAIELEHQISQDGFCPVTVINPDTGLYYSYGWKALNVLA